MDDLIWDFEGKTTLAQYRESGQWQIHAFTVSLFAQTIKSYQTPLLDISTCRSARDHLMYNIKLFIPPAKV